MLVLGIYNLYIIVWAVIIAASLIVEILTDDLVSIWATIGAIGGLVACLLGAKLWLQLVVFFFITIVSILISRPFIKKMQRVNKVHTNADRVIGMVGVVTKKFSINEIGYVTVNNQSWRAICEIDDEFNDGDEIIVEALSGTKLIVSKKDNNDKFVRL